MENITRIDYRYEVMQLADQPAEPAGQFNLVESLEIAPSGAYTYTCVNKRKPFMFVGRTLPEIFEKIDADLPVCLFNPALTEELKGRLVDGATRQIDRIVLQKYYGDMPEPLTIVLAFDIHNHLKDVSQYFLLMYLAIHMHIREIKSEQGI